jgi:uncharacterized membrane protein YkvA (DUF1232 family)
MSMDKPNLHKPWPPFWIYLTGMVGLVYILNPTMGVFELIPDNLPIVGNLDEGAAAILVWNAIQQYRASRRAS